MGCNCKKTRDKFKQYADNKEDLDREDSGIDQNIVNKVAGAIFQFFFGIIVAIIVIIVIVPMLIYIIICTIIGREPSVTLINPYKRFKKKNARKQ